VSRVCLALAPPSILEMLTLGISGNMAEVDETAWQERLDKVTLARCASGDVW